MQTLGFSMADVEAATRALAAFADRDLRTLEPREKLAAQRAAAALARVAQVPLAAISAAVAAEPRTVARGEGHQSPTHLTAATAGGGLGQARDTIEAGELLAPPDDAPAPFPLVAGAFAAGRLSPEQAALVRRTLERLEERGPELEARLLEKAESLPLWDLRRACRELLTRHSPSDALARERWQREERSVRIIDEADGTVVITARLDPASAAPVRAWLEAQVTDEYRRRRSQDPAMVDRRPRWQIMADAFSMLFSHGLDCDRPTSGVKTTVVVRLPIEALREELGSRASLALGDCDQAISSLTAGTLRRMAVDAEILPAVLGGASEVLDLGRQVRLFTRRQRLAIIERDGGCAFCHAPPAWVSVHHIKWWHRDGGRTDLADAVALCTSCHHRIHDDGWEVCVRAGTVWFTPPGSVDPARTPRLGGRRALEVWEAA
ncbi:HNH endonuclease signature motif containing protein [Demequina gelatinilytica]|uniref:HNH endonuclease signature motif containing protein n=1 Tax=Demequina gelatinilytica TaxID=1638980 RepID=UPI0007837EAF|nr:HNH endonuclease signature motif containing protein [Demequina gelatinilytica]